MALLQHGVRGHFPTVAGPKDDDPHGQVYIFGYHGQEKAHATRPHTTGGGEGWSRISKRESGGGLLEEGVTSSADSASLWVLEGSYARLQVQCWRRPAVDVVIDWTNKIIRTNIHAKSLDVPLSETRIFTYC